VIVKPLVVAIYTSPQAGLPLHAVPEATLEAGKGIVGDRYYTGVGTFSPKLHGRADKEVTLIECEEIQRFNDSENASKALGEFRRNIVTRDVRLNDLVGQRFSVGEVVLEGIRLCEPCAHLTGFVSPTVVKTMLHRAGIRARIVSGGIVRPGDKIRTTVS
jgi:MOSC domain-containing protein YiiM